MSTAHLTTNRDRRSKRYLAIHEALRSELNPDPTKQDRRRQASQDYRRRGGE